MGYVGHKTMEKPQKVVFFLFFCFFLGGGVCRLVCAIFVHLQQNRFSYYMVYIMVIHYNFSKKVAFLKYITSVLFSNFISIEYIFHIKIYCIYLDLMYAKRKVL